MRLSEPAPAKLNLALHVRRKRDDGYHELDTLFAFCIDGDMLHTEAAENISLQISGPFANSLGIQDNLVIRAAGALAEAAGVSDGVALHLVKNLPIASGLGGGSADAAAALRLLTRFWSIDPSHAQQVAPTLGADVPACLLSLTARGEGVGDQLTPVDMPELAGQPVLLANPLVGLSTAEIFAAWTGEDGGPLPEDWRDGRNDLEAAARARVPEIGDLLRWLEARPGCNLARMSGSGASCFALFDSHEERDAAALLCPDGWWHLASELR